MAPIIRGSSLYVTVDGPSWTQAEANAVKLGGHLAAINSGEENIFLFENYGFDSNGRTISSGYWIGLTKTNEWKWSNGEQLLWHPDHWFRGEPNGNGNYVWIKAGFDYPNMTYAQYLSVVNTAWTTDPNNRGAKTYATNGGPDWDDTGLSGERTNYGVAEIPFVQRGDSAYVIVEGPTWEAAEANAVKLGGHLVTINDAAENEWLSSTFKDILSVPDRNWGNGLRAGAWIGLNDKSQDGRPYWSSQQVLNYTNYGERGQNTGAVGQQDGWLLLMLDPSGGAQRRGGLNTWWTEPGTTIPNYWLYNKGIAEIKLTTSPPTPTYSLSPSSTSIDEGSALTTTVSTTNVASGTTLYYSLSGTGVTTTDFSSGSLTGSGTVSSGGSFSFSHTLANDLTTEGTETLQIRLFTDSSRSTQVASTSVSINDTSITPPALPSYLLTPSTTTINEGSLVSTTINTTNVASGITLYWSAVGSGITTSDFSFGALNGTASIGSDGKATFSHVLANDLTTEGSETLNILLYSDSNRSNQVATTSIAITDTSIAPATPTVAVNGNNTGVINTGTINNSGTINSGTINTNSGNTTNTTTNTSNVTVGPTIINNITNNITNTTTNTTSVLSNTSYPTYNVNNTFANNLVTGAITGSAPTLAKNSFDYKFYNLGGGRYGVQEKGSSKIDEITGASSLKFSDQTLTPANDVAATFNQVKGKDDVSGVVFRLYNAAFSRLPDANGLQNWINGNASGNVTYASSAQNFSESQEFKNRYGSNVTDTQFITTLYNNVLGRAPDAGGLSHYQSLLAGGRSRGALLLDFSESPENRVLFTQVTGLA